MVAQTRVSKLITRDLVIQHMCRIEICKGILELFGLRIKGDVVLKCWYCSENVYRLSGGGSPLRDLADSLEESYIVLL